MNEASVHALRTVWQMMRTMESGLLGQLDLSPKGARASFRAILVALPSLAIGWVGSARVILGAEATAEQMVSLITGIALSGLVEWMVPLVVFIPLLWAVGLGPRYNAFLVTTNWAGAIFAFLAVPIGVGRILFPTAAEFDAILILVILGIISALYWRLLRAALGIGGGQAVAFVFISLLLSMLSSYGMAEALGLQFG
ncbi:hypothetical protein [Notoacmeibacter ruber]|uniref:Yip1 domain-containing protein n=1 Tax=Notoacmeibacter ruber TaxID=2670375 RepID=A0A3L7JBZ9_9HYPH|nr:hypothetical protein [Notoacmeibacter ruber]RLQ87061.1 hypothetical protein D8780_01360 [Notoacmeibacter ruber]